MAHFLFRCPQSYLRNGWCESRQILSTWWNISNASLGMTDYPLMGVVRVTWPIFKILSGLSPIMWLISLESVKLGTWSVMCWLVQSCVCPSVCLSVTSWHYTNIPKGRITQKTPHNSLGILVFCCQRSRGNSDGVSLSGAPSRIRRFSTNISLYLKNGGRQERSCYGMIIGTRMRSIEWQTWTGHCTMAQTPPPPAIRRTQAPLRMIWYT